MKKTTMRKTLLASFIVAFSVCMGASTMCLSAGAEETAVTVDTATVTMAKGASARISEDGHNGLRYTMEMSADDYKGLKKTYGADIKFGILIAPASYTAMTEETVFGESAIYDWATYNEETEEWVYTGENGANGSKKRIINLTSAGMKADVNDASKYVMYGTIADMNETNFAREFAGVGYIEYTVDGVTDYKFLADNDNTRSMAYVAQVYQTLDDSVVSAADKALVKATYITGKADQVDTFYTVNHMLSDGNGNYTVGETEEVTAKINGTTVAPTAKTFDGYCYDASNANNSAGGDLVYANGKTTALNIYYTNDWNKDFVKNADGSYSMTQKGHAWSGGPAWAYTYTTETPATMAVYSVKMEASAALKAPVNSASATGIIVSQGERIADQDTTFAEWADLNNASGRNIPMNSIYGTVFGPSHNTGRDIQIVTNRGMGWHLNGIGFGTASRLSESNNEITMTLALYENVFYMYIDDAFVGTINVNDTGDWNGLVALKVPSGNKYGYDNNVGFRFGVGNYNNDTDVKFTVVTEKYGEEALAEMNANSIYKTSILTPMTANVTKNADGSYTHTYNWFKYSYAYTSTKFSDTVVYKTQITANDTDFISCNDGWEARVGIAFTNGDTTGSNNLSIRNNGVRSNGGNANWLSGGWVGLSVPGTATTPNAKRITFGGGVDSNWQTTPLNTSEAMTSVTLTAVLYKGTIYVYFNDTFVVSKSLDDACFDYTNAEGVAKTMSSSDKLIFGTSAILMKTAPTTKELQYLTDNEALTEITTNSIYANIGVTA